MKSLVQWFVTDSAEFSCSRNELPVFIFLYFERTDLFARRWSKQFAKIDSTCIKIHHTFQICIWSRFGMNFAARWINQKSTKNKPKNRPKNRGTPSALGDQSRGTPSAQVVVVLGTFLAASWEALGGVIEASWAEKVANMAPTWPQVGAQNGGKIRLGPSWRRLGSVLEASCSRFYAFLMHFCCMP